MSRHMRNHQVGTETRTGTSRPEWSTLDRQPTEPFSANVGRCQRCGDSLRATAGGVWLGKITGLAVCSKAPRRPWPTSRHHLIAATHPTSIMSPDRLLVVLLVVGPAVLFVAIAVASVMTRR